MTCRPLRSGAIKLIETFYWTSRAPGSTLKFRSQMPTQIDLLHQVSKIISSGSALDKMLGELIRLAVQVTDCDACLVYLADSAGEIVLRASQLPHAGEIGHLSMH